MIANMASQGGGARRKSTTDRGCLVMALAFFLVGAAFGSFFVARVWRDVRIFTVWKPTTCTIMEKKISSTGGSGNSKPSYRPDITFRYEIGGKEYRCTGWDSWALSGLYGGGSSAYYGRVLDRFEIGRTYPCWYDPTDPTRAVLTRGVRAGYVLAVLPLALTVLGAIGLWSLLSRTPRRLGISGKAEARRRSREGHDRASAGKRPWDVQRLPVRLQAESRPATQSCGALLVAIALLFVGAIAGYALWSAAQDASFPILPAIFVIVFGGLGLLFLWIAAASALASHVPETILEVNRSTLAPGEEAEIILLQPGPLRLRSLRVRLVGREETPAKTGSPDVTALHDELVTEIGPATVGREAPLEHAARFRVPGDARASAAGPPTVRWRLEVWGTPLVWPRFMLTFPIMVAKAAAPVEPGASQHDRA
jgi:hypothetical protein